MAYTTVNKSSSFMNNKLYTGNGGTQALTGVGFQPDWVWLKSRSVADSPILFDAVRGATKRLMSNSTSAESTEAQEVQSFDSDGFTVGNSDNANRSGATMVGWNWLGANGTAANTNGDIASTVSANTTSGFSIVSYTGTGSNATVGHGLGAVPKMIITKNLQQGNEGWLVYHASMGNTKKATLNTDATEGTDATAWNSTTPTNNVFYIGTNWGSNGNGHPMIAYCFSDVQGHQKMGSYTGNNPAGGTNTQFVYTGFKPRLVMCKEMSGAGNWNIYDLNRNYNLTENNYNVRAARLAWNLGSAESSFTDDHGIDILSNGFNIRDNSNDLYTINANNETYMYYAVGQTLVGTNNIPNNAV